MTTEKQPTVEPQATRSEQVQQLYFNNFGFITDTALSDPRLTHEDAQLIVEGVARHLHEYDGELTDAAFEAWMADIIKPAIAFYGIKRECQGSVCAALFRTLGSSNQFDDYAAVRNELESEVWLWVFLNLDKLAVPGTASLTSRLYARARWIARAYLKKQLIRYHATMKRVRESGWDSFGVPTVSLEEIASMQADLAECA